VNGQGFIMLPYSAYDSPKFAALKPIDIAVLLLLIRKHTGRNNGNISLGVREVAIRCHCGKTTASQALKSLQDADLITATYKGHLVPEIGRPDVATRWN
jgi:predicted transcriptional regulator